MKKIGLLFLLVAGSFFLGSKAQAQANWEAGIRAGDNFSIEATIPINARPRVKPVVYFDRVGVAGYFDWMFALEGGPLGLKFFPGVGPEFMFGNNTFDFNIAGDFGVEYSFVFPLTIGFDWRPHFVTTNNFNFNAGNWGFVARFRFGEGVKFKATN